MVVAAFLVGAALALKLTVAYVAPGLLLIAVAVLMAEQRRSALLFLLVALAFRHDLIYDVFEGSVTLYNVLVVGTLAYAASYFARGWLAGHERFGLFGGLVLMEATSRVCFALAVAVPVVHHAPAYRSDPSDATEAGKLALRAGDEEQIRDPLVEVLRRIRDVVQQCNDGIKIEPRGHVFRHRRRGEQVVDEA